MQRQMDRVVCRTTTAGAGAGAGAGAAVFLANNMHLLYLQVPAYIRLDPTTAFSDCSALPHKGGLPRFPLANTF